MSKTVQLSNSSAIEIVDFERHLNFVRLKAFLFSGSAPKAPLVLLVDEHACTYDQKYMRMVSWFYSPEMYQEVCYVDQRVGGYSVRQELVEKIMSAALDVEVGDKDNAKIQFLFSRVGVDFYELHEISNGSERRTIVMKMKNPDFLLVRWIYGDPLFYWTEIFDCPPDTTDTGYIRPSVAHRFAE